MRFMMIAFLMVCSILFSVQSFSEPRKHVDPPGIVVNGQGENKQASITDALRNAVEQVQGVFVNSLSQSVNQQLASDQVDVLAQGYVKSYKVMQTNRDEVGIFHSLVYVVVDVKALFADFDSISIEYDPSKVLVMLDSVKDLRTRLQTAKNMLQSVLPNKQQKIWKKCYDSHLLGWKVIKLGSTYFKVRLDFLITVNPFFRDVVMNVLDAAKGLSSLDEEPTCVDNVPMNGELIKYFPIAKQHRFIIAVPGKYRLRDYVNNLDDLGSFNVDWRAKLSNDAVDFMQGYRPIAQYDKMTFSWGPNQDGLIDYRDKGHKIVKGSVFFQMQFSVLDYDWWDDFWTAQQLYKSWRVAIAPKGKEAEETEWSGENTTICALNLPISMTVEMNADDMANIWEAKLFPIAPKSPHDSDN